MAEITTSENAIPLIQRTEASSLQFLNTLLEKPFVQQHIVPHLGNLVSVDDNGHSTFRGGILYMMKIVTQGTNKLRSYSIPLRMARAEAVHEIRNASTTTETKKTILHAEHQRETITDELYHHTLMEVDTSLGKLGGQVSILNEKASGIPVVFIPGSSNDPASVETAAVSLALQTRRKVIIIGYPDGPEGSITEEFSQAVINDTKQAQENYKQHPANGIAPTYAPYIEFFDAMIKKMYPQGDFELWGFSAGSAISAKLLAQEKYQNRVTQAVLLNPGGSATFAASSDIKFQAFVALESLTLFAEGKRIPYATWIDDPRNPKTNDDKRRKVNAWTALYNGCARFRIPDWEQIRTKGKIIVFSGGKDFATRSYLTFNDKTKPINSSLDVLYDPNASHATIMTHADETVGKILKLQQQSK